MKTIKKITEHPMNAEFRKDRGEMTPGRIKLRIEAIKFVKENFALQELIRDLVDSYYEDKRNVAWWIAEALENGLLIEKDDDAEEICRFLQNNVIFGNEEVTDSYLKYWARMIRPEFNDLKITDNYLKILEEELKQGEKVKL